MKYSAIVLVLAAIFGISTGKSLSKPETFYPVVIEALNVDVNIEMIIVGDVEHIFTLYPLDTDRVWKLAEKLNLNENLSICTTIPNRWNVIAFNIASRIYKISNPNQKFVQFSYYGYGFLAFNECDAAPARGH